MAHELEVVDGKASMAWAGDMPWHGLGTKVDPDLTPIQMLKAANLDWKVNKCPVHVELPDGSMIQDKRAVALMRSSDNKRLSLVSPDWEPVQNVDAFRFFNEFVLGGKMEMHTAGSLRDGNLVWGLAKVKESFQVFGGDQVDSYLLFSNPHEYGACIDIRFTPIRVVCANTLTLSLNKNSKSMLKLNHRKKFDADLAKQVLGLAHEKLHTYKQVAELLGSVEYTDKKVLNYLDKIFPFSGTQEEEGEIKRSRTAQRAYEILETQPGAEFAKNTWWSAFNAVTYMTDHIVGNSNANRLNSAWYGVNREKKAYALELAVDYADGKGSKTPKKVKVDA